jgi:trimeric autotransporter adhesin
LESFLPSFKTMKKLLYAVLVVFTLTILSHQFSTVFAQGTAFTYQGHLNAGGVAANGSYDLQFMLFITNTTGVAIAGPVTNSATAVSNGLFTTAIDFGPGVFIGESNWLDIAVRTNNGGAFTELAPRQQVTPTPYAIYAEGAASANSVSAGNISGVVPLTELPPVLVTNNAMGVTLSGNLFGNFGGSFFGNGAGLTGLNATTLSGMAATAFWQLGGNNVSVGQVLGSTNNQSVVFEANGQQIMVLQPDPTDVGAPNIVAGSPVNYLTEGRFGPVHGSAILVGGSTYDANYAQAFTNFIAASYSTIAGGAGNTVALGNGAGQSEPDFNFIGGGMGNTVNNASVVGGGALNTAGAEVGYAAVVGGYHNNASGDGAFVGGGGLDDQTASDLRNVIAGNSATAPASTVVGGMGNSATDFGAFVGAGGDDGSGAIAGNTAGGMVSTVAGGFGNKASGDGAFVGGGGDDEIYSELGNTAGGGGSVVVGGIGNNAGADYSFIGGGWQNTNNGTYATIPGGYHNLANGKYSFAAGQNAQATNQGAFVWADSQAPVFNSTASNQFLVRAQGGVGINLNSNPDQLGQTASLYVQGTNTIGWKNSVVWFQNTASSVSNAPALRVVNTSSSATNVDGALSVSIQGQGLIAEFGNAGAFVVTITNNGTIYATAYDIMSDRNAKENFAPVSTQDILARVAALPITRWNYKTDTSTPHIGPMAQDFHAAFDLDGADDKHISVVDESGVALAAIQGLNQKLEQQTQEKDTEIADLKKQLSDLQAAVEALQQRQKGD